MYFKDHAPPHFHAIYAEHEAEVEISTGKVLRGSLPRRSERLKTRSSAQLEQARPACALGLPDRRSASLRIGR